MHRLNNVLKRPFFLSQNKKKNNEAQSLQLPIASNHKNKNQDDDLSASTSEDENETFLSTTKPKKKVRKDGNQPISNDSRKLILSDMDL